MNQVVVAATDELQVPRADLVAGGAVGIQFNARLEIETRHSPTAQPSGNISHAPGFFDFIATGIFTLEPDQVLLGAPFNGEDGDPLGLTDLARPLLLLRAAQPSPAPRLALTGPRRRLEPHNGFSSDAYRFGRCEPPLDMAARSPLPEAA